MRNFARAFALLASSSLLLASCSEIDGQDDGFSVVSATETSSVSFNSAHPVFQVSPTTRTVVIDGVEQGARVFVARVNPTSYAVSADTARFVESSSGIARESARSVSGVSFGEEIFDDGIYGVTVDAEFEPSRAAAASVSGTISVSEGVSRKIVVDHAISNGSVSDFYAENFVISAVGENCIVWMKSTSGAVYRARAIAEKFDAMCGFIRESFGDECDGIFTSAGSCVPAGGISATGTFVNIVVYDIGGDYVSTGSGSIAGYFSSKDFYAEGIAKNTNAGKYIYIDEYFVMSRFELAVSTLAHEFQHMIHFYQKTVLRGVKSELWFNEMLSMLCEDLIQDKMGISDSNSPKNRLPRFIRDYSDCGLEFRSELTLLSYSASYAFGAWLAREFGGIAVIGEMAKNALTGMKSVTAAVGTVLGRDVSAEWILCQYAQACVFNGEMEYDYPTFNQHEGALSAIDLWKVGSRPTGPLFLGASDRHEIRPFGMTISEVGVAEGGSVLLSLNSEGSSAQEVFVFVK